MTLPQGMPLGSYRIVGFIGRGGMAEVYKAYQPSLDRFVALKVLPDFFLDDKESLNRFHEEARSIARLNHPNIVRIFDSLTVDAVTFLALEFVDGRPLGDLIGQPMQLEETIRILRPIASAMDHAHSLGILHRDIKPSNILVRGDGTPMLTDFGLALPVRTAKRITASGTVVGTPEYMSPEQVSGERLGPESDQYALAVVAYEMLTGRIPFQGDTPVAVLYGHLSKAVPNAPELVGELAAHLETVLKRGMAKAAADRFETAAAFVAALEPAVWVRADRSEAPRANSALLPLQKRRQRVLVVDDSLANRELIEASLEGVDCEIHLAADGESALEAIRRDHPDLVLLDIQMPGMDGHAVCREVKSTPEGRLLPVVMITGLQGVDDRIAALESGADDFLAKPVDRTELVARVRSLLRMRAVYDTLDNAERVIYALAAAVEARDPYTDRHTQRVAEMARRMGVQLGLVESDVDDLFRGALVHDIGKIAMPDAILLKQAPLTDEEAAQMRLHPVIGAKIISPLGSRGALLSVIRHHHESFDGSGYPDGLAGETIPLAARIVAVCDAHDALITDRPYRARKSPGEALSVLRAGAGTQWDPAVVNLLDNSPE